MRRLALALCPASHVGLVGNYHEKKSGGFETLAADQDILVKFKFLHVLWRIWTAVSDEGPVEHAVAIEENSAARYFVLSHFVCATLSFGWLTKRCQTTARNASEFGVV